MKTWEMGMYIFIGYTSFLWVSLEVREEVKGMEKGGSSGVSVRVRIDEI